MIPRAYRVAASLTAVALTALALRLFAPVDGRPFAQALLLFSAFMLRIWDRRWTVRPGWRGWTSHVRMKPARLLLWPAIGLLGGMPALAALLLGELLLYPLMVRPLAPLSRRGLLIALVLLAGTIDGLTRLGHAPTILRDLAPFATGTLLATFWLRSPDGEPRELLISIAAAMACAAIGWTMPATLSWSEPATLACLLLILAHSATLRRTPLHWRGYGFVFTTAWAFTAIGFRRRRFAPASRPS